MTIVIDSTRCTACGVCLLTCPPRALVPGRGRPDVLDERCTVCLAFVEVCRRDAVGVVRRP